jgi:hypothetical protein
VSYPARAVAAPMPRRISPLALFVSWRRNAIRIMRHYGVEYAEAMAEGYRGRVGAES